MTDLVEIGLLWNAQKYGEIEPLIERLQTHGLTDPEARQFVGQLALGKAVRGRGKQPANRDREKRDHFICCMIASLDGAGFPVKADAVGVHSLPPVPDGFENAVNALAKDGEPVCAIALVGKQMQLSSRHVERIWALRRKTGTLRWARELGRQGLIFIE